VPKDGGLVLDWLQVISSTFAEEVLQNSWRPAYAGERDLFFWEEAILTLHASKCEQVLLVPEGKACVPR
jgi:hypothetical protein